MLRSLFISCCLLLAAPTLSFPQTASSRIVGISEPPELSGEPKKLVTPSEADRQFYEIFGQMKNDEAEVKATIPKFDQFIAQHTDYSEAYFLRATLNFCLLNSRDFAAISSDVKSAMSHTRQGLYNDADYYSMLGKIAMETAKYAEAMDDLEIAMKRDPGTADKMFSIEGTEPAKTSKPCAWNLTDLDTLIGKFPKDYRAWIFRGLYYQFFTTFKEDYYAKAMQQFQQAAILNPTSALVYYFIGEVFTKESFWTKKAWASDAGRDEATKNAVQAYTKAIQLDPKFLPAIKERASGYLNLKQYPQSIKDFDKVLTLDPESTTAYSDRGIAKLESGQYLSATFDFKNAIRRKSEGDSFLTNLYEYQGDANVKLGYFSEAITDYTKAIEKQLSNETLLLSLKNFRALYPEYDGISDDALCEKLHILFFPNLEYKGFAKMLMVDNKQHSSFLLSGLYEKRGDTYLQSGDYRRGVIDFNRIFRGIPDMAEATDRWRPLGTSADGEQFYLDVKSFESGTNGPVRLWIKTVGKKETDTLAYEMDCKAARMNNTATTAYDSSGKLVKTSEASSGWQRIIPDTIGEKLFNGACSVRP